MTRLPGTTRHRRLPSSQAEQGLRPCQKTATRGPHAHATDHPFHPLRLALTGRESGPEMAGLVVQMGKARALERLNAAARR